MAESSEHLLIESLPVLEQIIESICARKGMGADEIEEFSADVKLRLVNNDYAIIKAFKNRSSFPTFLAAVVSRLLLDYRNRVWGKWRDSANAQQLGPAAVSLERLLHRDKRSFDDALTILTRQYPGLTREGVERLADRLRARTGRKSVSLDEAAPLAAEPCGIDVEGAETAQCISNVVRAYLGELPDEDRLIFQLRFESDLAVREIAASLHLDQQKVFRRLYRHFEELRKRLTYAGVDADDVEKLIGRDTTFLDFQLKNGGVRPSDEKESAVGGRHKDISS